MTAKVAGLTRYHKKGEPGEALSEAKLLEGFGMDGDMHQGGERQLSLLSAETRGWMESQAEKGLCFGRFRENILIGGLPLDQVTDGSLLSVGDTVLRISVCRKHCYSECGLLLQGVNCRLSGGAVFAVVEHGGTVRIGDPVYIPGLS